MSEWIIPGGDHKGMPIKDAPDSELMYWADRIGRELDEGKVEEKYKDYTIKKHKAFIDELASRGHAQQELPHTKQTVSKESAKQPDKLGAQSIPEEKAEIVVSSTAELTGSYRNEQKLNSIFEFATQNCHFVSPATSCPKLPEGCSIALSAFVVDKENDTYPTGYNLALSKSALQKISMMSGITWDPNLSGRLDDGSDPHYCSWQAVGEMRLFDGSRSTLIGSKEMDLREGSAQLQALWERYEAAKRDKAKNSNAKVPKEPTAQIREMRLHIAAHAETKAQLRAIRSIGIRTSYKSEELDKPFIVARLMFTGDTDIPALKEKFAVMQAEAMIGSGKSLYGDSYQPMPQLLRHSPPPIGSTKADNDDLPSGDDY